MLACGAKQVTGKVTATRQCSAGILPALVQLKGVAAWKSALHQFAADFSATCKVRRCQGKLEGCSADSCAASGMRPFRNGDSTNQKVALFVPRKLLIIKVN